MGVFAGWIGLGVRLEGAGWSLFDSFVMFKYSLLLVWCGVVWYGTKGKGGSFYFVCFFTSLFFFSSSLSRYKVSLLSSVSLRTQTFCSPFGSQDNIEILYLLILENSHKAAPIIVNTESSRLFVLLGLSVSLCSMTISPLYMHTYSSIPNPKRNHERQST